jgi:hypothetical protein
MQCTLLLDVIALAAALDGALVAAGVLVVLSLALGLRVLTEAASAMATTLEALPDGAPATGDAGAAAPAAAG